MLQAQLVAERRIGELLGPAVNTGTKLSLANDGSVTRDDRMRFRIIAKNWKLVEKCWSGDLSGKPISSSCMMTWRR